MPIIDFHIHLPSISYHQFLSLSKIDLVQLKVVSCVVRPMIVCHYKACLRIVGLCCCFLIAPTIVFFEFFLCPFWLHFSPTLAPMSTILLDYIKKLNVLIDCPFFLWLYLRYVDFIFFVRSRLVGKI